MAVLIKGYDPLFSIELKSKRTKDSKTFLNFDRSLTTIFYSNGKAVRKNATYYSEAAYDGYVRSTGEVSTGEQHCDVWATYRRGFVSFQTSGIPDSAVINSAYLRLSFCAIDNHNPILDIDYCLYGSLTSDDYNRAAEASHIAHITGPYNERGWANSETFTYVNKTGRSQYRLRCHNADNYYNCAIDSAESAYDPELHVTYTTIPTAPSGCVAHYEATNNAHCHWNDNSNNETGFRIEKAIDGAGFSFWKNVGAGVTSSGTYTLGANHRIKFQVRAYNAAGSSAYSISGYAYTTPAAPTGATTVYVATDNAKLTWTDASAYEDGFKLQYAIGAGGWTDWKTVGAGVQDSGNYSPGANTRIKFRVCAYKGGLYSVYSEGSYVYTTPTTPSGIALSWLSQDETVRVTWTDNSAYEQDFDIEKAVDGGGYGHLVYDVASPYDDTAPSGVNHRYIYRVRARCPDGRLSGWNTASAYIFSTPSPPTNCAIALGTINVTWTDNSAYEDAFQVERQLDEGGWGLVQTTAAEAEAWGDSSQPTGANVKYEYRVRAKIGTIYSTYSTSNVIFVKTCSESITLSDTYLRVWSIYRTFTESISLSDIYSRVCNWFRTFIESITLADTLQKKPAKTFAESIALVDTSQKKTARTFIESITLTDTYLRVWNIYRTFTETLNLVDTLIKKPIKTFIENLHLADTLIKRPAKIFTESITLADTLKKRAQRIFTETLSLTDTVSKKAVKSFLEVLHLQDRYTRLVTWYRTFTENITLTDTVRKVKSNLVQLFKKLMNLFDIEG